MAKKRLLTGLQPSGTLHIGNYFGALKPFVDTYEDYDSHLMVVDYHALTTLREPDTLRQNIIDVVKDYLAAGVDPEKALIFQQSTVAQHTELAWIFECLVTVPFLELSHAYKDKVAKGLEPNAGLFNYPMLMAADILLYDTDVVPVGEDQRQHIEYTREAATKFNNAFGETFTPPKEQVYATGSVPGVDGQKMSKSYKNTIPLFGTQEEVKNAVMSIKTDSEGEFPEYVYKIHAAFKSEEELIPLYNGELKGKYKDLKEALLTDLESLIAPMRQKRESISDEDVKNVLREGGEKARERAETKMKDVRKKIGISL